MRRKQKTRQIYLILDNIRSRENVGSIFRTADAAGVSKIYLCGITPTPQIMKYEPWNMDKKAGFKFPQPRQAKRGRQDSSDKIHKTALGAEQWMPWEYHKQTWRLLKQLRDNGLRLIALEKTKNSTNIFELKSVGRRPLAIIVGNEVKGLSPKILSYADKIIAIPMYGRKESLNVSVATGIALFSFIG
ncbi:MAG: RNA methyltransferase [Parcubacteria group bacterium]|nr:RNA methyltransferase [Parcubacteria group bacterium]